METMKNRNGFLLIPFLVYLMLFSLIVLFTCRIINSLIIPSFIKTRTYQSLIALHLVTDLLVKDLRSAHGKMHTWNLVTPHELIWHNGEKNIGWRFIENRLERTEGIYDNNKWKKKKRSIAAAAINEVTFIVETGNNVSTIECTLIPDIDKNYSINSFVAIKGK
jgi:hypothetical protein